MFFSSVATKNADQIRAGFNNSNRSPGGSHSKENQAGGTDQKRALRSPGGSSNARFFVPDPIDRAFHCKTRRKGETVHTLMHSQDDIHYALETTRVLHEPDRRIQTFGETRFEFQLISELMDRAGQVRIRTGEVEAQRPRILRPENFREIEFEGFNDSARERFDRLMEKFRAEGKDLAFLQYGFQFRRGEVHEQVVHETMDNVRDRMLGDIRRSGNPSLAIIEGVDDAWEICVLKFSFEMILRSQEINAFDFKRRGLI